VITRVPLDLRSRRLIVAGDDPLLVGRGPTEGSRAYEDGVRGEGDSFGDDQLCRGPSLRDGSDGAIDPTPCG